MLIRNAIVDKTTQTKANCCDRRKQPCIHSTISRSGDLLARRLTSLNGHPLNLAKLGKYQARQGAEYERKFKWLHIDFTSQEIRESFERAVEQTKEIYSKKLARYYEEMHRERQNHVG